MAYLAVRGSGAVNGVSRLHGAVSRRIFQPLFVRWPEVEIPIGHVTNGVHMPTWDSAQADGLWETLCGKARWQGTLQDVETHVRGASDADLWQLRCDERRSLVEFVRERLARQLAERGAPAEDIARAASHVRSRGADARLCPALRNLQAPELVVARSGSTRAAPRPIHSVRCSW